MGCQKQFKKNYLPKAKHTAPQNQSWKKTMAVAVSWIVPNAVIGFLYFQKIIDTGILIIISLAYAVCDIICILFFCPFQALFMKNRCCADCRIYNWDYAMMFTPLLFVPSFYTWSLLGCALMLLIRWEITYHRHPEYFSSNTNEAISCKNCNEKLCAHKRQLKSIWKYETKRRNSKNYQRAR